MRRAAGLIVIGACALGWSPAQARVRSGYEFDRGYSVAMTCVSYGIYQPAALSIDQPAAYRFYEGYRRIKGKKTPYYNAFQWRGPRGRVVTFVGKGSDDGPGWWFGTLNGKQAAGYNRNRRHFVFGTADMKAEFECWQKGWDHGNYGYLNYK